jgi:ABC-3C biological conflict system middle component
MIMSGTLLQEYEVMLNIGLGAEAIAAYANSFEETKHDAAHVITLWHLATVLPLIFHQASRRAISKRQPRSGLRSILTRDPRNDIAQNEPIFNLNARLQAMYPRTIRSVNCALAWGLIEVHNGAIIPNGTRQKPTFTGEAQEIVNAAKKLGIWSGELSAFEYFTILGIRLI